MRELRISGIATFLAWGKIGIGSDWQTFSFPFGVMFRDHHQRDDCPSAGPSALLL